MLGPAARLFEEQTGFVLQVVWAPSGALGWRDVPPSFCTDSCPLEARSRKDGGRCVEFDRGHLARMLTSRARSHGFLCPFHVRTVARKILAGDQVLGIAFFQVREETSGGPGAGSAPGHEDLKRARNLLKFVVHDTVETVLSEIEREWIDRLREELASSQRTECNLRTALHQLAPAMDGGPVSPEHRSHRDRIVARMLEYADTLYSRPVSLTEFARQAGMNRSYLSHLFSTSVGMPFRSYLKQLRIDRARGLLSDPLQRVSDVAYAVGYANPNRFRIDFKSQTGLAPSRWRERFATAE